MGDTATVNPSARASTEISLNRGKPSSLDSLQAGNAPLHRQAPARSRHQSRQLVSSGSKEALPLYKIERLLDGAR